MRDYYVTERQKRTFEELQDVVHKSCVQAGWYTDLDTGKPITRNFGEVIALMHSELSETLEGWRKNQMDSHLPDRPAVEVELADVIIRVLDTAGAMKLDLAGALRDKFAYNQTRADHAIENRRKAGGKKI